MTSLWAPCPVAAIPEQAKYHHRFRVRVGEVGVALVAADDDVVDLEYDVLGVPDDGVRVVIGRRVEPESEHLLFLTDPVGPNIGAEDDWLARLASGASQELHVDLVTMVVLP
jgi:hypothetical protein